MKVGYQVLHKQLSPNFPDHADPFSRPRLIQVGRMASVAQVTANRANAQLSTGPRTDADKAAAIRNASSHGLCQNEPNSAGPNCAS
jgi:hypothetical protein